MKSIHSLLMACIILSSAALISCNLINTGGKPVVTVKNVDLKRYMGLWYEIARFDHRFERNLVGATATYTLDEKGKISVLNQGYEYTLDGKHKTANGRAKVPNMNEPGKLKVYFFLFFGADYYIMELDEENYSYALVGSSTMKYLWILGRSPQMPDATYTMLINKAKERGYDTDKLIKVKQ